VPRLTRNQVRPVTNNDIGLKVLREATVEAAQSIEYAHFRHWFGQTSTNLSSLLRTYRYLIRHESDFHLAQQDSLRLIPKDVGWGSFCQFTSELNHIEDAAVSGRYYFGELRLTRLNFYAPLLLRRFHFEQAHGQYGDYFARLYGPVLFVFAVMFTILNSMQVALAVDQSLAMHWVVVWHASRWFSVVGIIGTAVVALCFVVLWLWMFLDEWVYTLRQKSKAWSALLDVSKC
jgi:hypothetical protein